MKVPIQVTPNWLTVLRIALIPTGVWAIFHDPSNLWQCIAWSIFFILGMTDILDGHWARKSGRTSALGAFLDPVADKALIGAAMISLVIQDRFSIVVMAIILFREIGITLFRLLVIRGGVIPASKGGKIKTLMQNFGVGFYILPLPDLLYPLRDLFMGVAVLLTIWTGIDYIVKWSKGRSRFAP
jgi:CDP-diacylglycerol--glycerol-3-phosphate 3-phosphatidyltransferase